MTRVRKVIHVIQGEQAVADDETVILTTVLGSCVSACLYDPARRIGGMNHFLLPDAPERHDLRFASSAMEALRDALLARGAERSRLRAKLFGGARMLAGLPDIGSRNAASALEFLEGEGIPCSARSLGGTRGRRIRFWPTTGRAQQIILDANDGAPLPAADLTAGGIAI
jgi:chemotaxis protein CheD